MDGIDPHMLAYEREEIETELRTLLKARLGYLESQISDGYNYLGGLEIDLFRVERDLISEIEAYQQFINERILWVRSAAPLGLIDLQKAWAGLVRMFDVPYWRTVANEMLSDLRENPELYVVFAGVLIPLFGVQRWLRRRRSHGRSAYRTNLRRRHSTHDRSRGTHCTHCRALAGPCRLGGRGGCLLPIRLHSIRKISPMAARHGAGLRLARVAAANLP